MCGQSFFCGLSNYLGVGMGSFFFNFYNFLKGELGREGGKECFYFKIVGLLVGERVSMGVFFFFFNLEIGWPMGLVFGEGSMNVFWAFLINGKGGLGGFYFPLFFMIGGWWGFGLGWV